MICYRDVTFCSASDYCKVKDCFRNMTAEEKAKADKWGEQLEGITPIAYSDFSKRCPTFDPMEKSSDEQ